MKQFPGIQDNATAAAQLRHATRPASFMKPQVTKLVHPIHCGDWHDKPLRWNVICGSKNQMFSTKKDAVLYARIWRRAGDEMTAINEYQKLA
jgi:hypothetical protein